MAMCSQARAFLSNVIIWTLLSFSLSYATETDIRCLKAIKDSLQDPLKYLNTSWDFNNKTEGYICRFMGIECWHPDENKVLNIKLSDMELKGQFPIGVEFCTSLTGLDLSNNKLSGNIPSNVSNILKFATSLDLSSNNFSGEIPVGLANCSYLNVLKLDNNRLSGQIPLQLGLLDRLKTFSVANNLLTGPVPTFKNNSIGAESYANNLGLCGGPLDDCVASRGGSRIGVTVGAAMGGITFAAIAVAIFMFFYLRSVAKRRKKTEDPLGNRWAKSLKGTKGVKVSLFENSVSKMRLGDLMKATDSFSKENIIGTGRTGTVYKAVFDDGTSLMVKRLQESQHTEKEFASEMATLGRVKHRNLVPLLGFCVAKKERFLVYRYMPKGTLYQQLHCLGEEDVEVEVEVEAMDWPSRLKIAIGAARGLAWLHHNCNPRIIHRNISSKSILLDADFEPKISDFGLARLMNPIDTHLSTFVNGEFGDLGYVAPEYARTLVATPKGDVYSFGIVLLELVTGERPTFVKKAPESFKGNLVEWVTQMSSNSQLEETIDESLVGNGVDAEIFQVLKVACNCVTPEVPKERPTMFEVYQLLRAIGELYHFTVEDEIVMPSESGETGQLEELIVAQDVKGNN